jgi:short-subunit dehydrogenase
MLRESILILTGLLHIRRGRKKKDKTKEGEYYNGDTGGTLMPETVIDLVIFPIICQFYPRNKVFFIYPITTEKEETVKRIRFSGKTVLITGASTGIGKALSREFAKRGANLALGSIPDEKDILSQWAEELSSNYGIQTWIFPIDLLKEDGPEKLHKEVSDTVGTPYAFVNNAGTVAYGKFWEKPWDRQFMTFQLNLYVPMKLMHLFLPDMVKKGEGTIYNTCSVSGLQPTPFQSIYGATKAGLESFSRAVRAELKGTGVTVCALCPPYIDTRLLTMDGYPEDLRFFTISGKKSSQWLAKKALPAFEKRKLIYVPGLSAKLIHDFLVRLSPRWMVDMVSRFALQGWKQKP